MRVKSSPSPNKTPKHTEKGQNKTTLLISTIKGSLHYSSWHAKGLAEDQYMPGMYCGSSSTQQAKISPIEKTSNSRIGYMRAISNSHEGN